VKRAVEKGGSCWRVAARCEVSVSFVVKLMQRWREHGTLTPEPMGGRKPQRPAGHAERVRALVAADPDLTIDGLRRRLADEGVTVGGSVVGRTLLALGLTLKTYGPPRWQVGRCWLGSVVRKRIRRSGASAGAMMEIRASWSS
jgi:transposase